MWSFLALVEKLLISRSPASVEDDMALAITRLVDTEEAVTALRKAVLQTDILG
jgi:hypothetical protein